MSIDDPGTADTPEVLPSKPGRPDWLPSEVMLDRDGRLDADHACRRCGYVLRGQSPEGRCPECGTAVGWSVLGDRLQFCDPDWVDRLARGALGLSAGVVVGVVSVFTGEPVETAGALTAAIVTFAGLWLLTTPEPGVERDRMDVRAWLRICAVAGLVVKLLQAGSFFVMNPTGPLDVVVFLVGVALMVLRLAGVVLIVIHLRRLARRIPDPKLEAATNTVVTSIVLSGMIAAILGGVIIFLASQGTGGMGGVAFGGVMLCGVIVGVIVFGIWWIVILFEYRSSLRQAAGVARSTWMTYGRG